MVDLDPRTLPLNSSTQTLGPWWLRHRRANDNTPSIYWSAPDYVKLDVFATCLPDPRPPRHGTRWIHGRSRLVTGSSQILAGFIGKLSRDAPGCIVVTWNGSVIAGITSSTGTSSGVRKETGRHDHTTSTLDLGYTATPSPATCRASRRGIIQVDIQIVDRRSHPEANMETHRAIGKQASPSTTGQMLAHCTFHRPD